MWFHSQFSLRLLLFISEERVHILGDECQGEITCEVAPQTSGVIGVRSVVVAREAMEELVRCLSLWVAAAAVGLAQSGQLLVSREGATGATGNHRLITLELTPVSRQLGIQR